MKVALQMSCAPTRRSRADVRMAPVAWRAGVCGMLISSAAVLAGCSSHSPSPDVAAVVYVPSGPVGIAQVCSEVRDAGSDTATAGVDQRHALGTLVVEADKISDVQLKAAAQKMSEDVKSNDSVAANHDLQRLRSRCEALGL